MELDDVAAWLDAYVRAWESNDPSAIGELFTEDAVYFPSPYDVVRPDWGTLHGRAAIVSAWLEDPDPPGSWVADYRPEAIASDLAIATGTSTYFHEGGETVRAEYSNVSCCDSMRRCAAASTGSGTCGARPDSLIPPPAHCACPALMQPPRPPPT